MGSATVVELTPIVERRAVRRDNRPTSAALRLRSFVLMLLVDIACIVIACAFVAAVRGALFGPSWTFVVGALVPVYLVVALNGHAYAADTLRRRFRAALIGARALLIAITMITLAAYFLKTSALLPRLTVGLGTTVAITLLGFARFWTVTNLQDIVGGDPYGVALILEPGQPVPASAFTTVIAADSFLDPESDDPMMYDRLASALAGLHNVVVSCRPEQRLAWAHALKGANIQGEILMPELQPLAPLGTNRHGTTTSVVVAHGPLNLAERAVKRVFDLTVAALALLVLVPLLLPVAIAIKIDTRGPVFFRQNRIGRGNRVFRVFKFRSMRLAELDHHGGRSASRDDDRITGVGRFIRRTSIDELPQLLNVLRGDMSIVGPRPHALGSRAADKLFWEVDGRYWHRHAAKPGMTGLAQVRGYRGATLEEDDLRNRLQADLEYLDTWSIWRDLKIIAMTFQVLVHRNAF